jgi:hypothetical protein
MERAAAPSNPEANYFTVSAGAVSFRFDERALDDLGLRFVPQGELETEGISFAFEIDPSSTLEVEAAHGRFTRIVGGAVHTCGAFLLDRPGERIVVGNLIVEAEPGGAFTVKSTLEDPDHPLALFTIASTFTDFSTHEGTLWFGGELTLADSFASVLGEAGLRGISMGEIGIDAETQPFVSHGTDSVVCRSAAGVTDQGLSTAAVGPDVLVADLQEMLRYTRIGDITAFAVGTNACNIGTERVNWIASRNQHPVILQNAYRLNDNRFEQIGMAWIKHGFYALSGSVCSPCNDPTSGNQLGVGCSDPYSASLNGVQTNMSLRSIVNANTGYFPYSGPTPAASTAIERRLQIHDADLDPALNTGARYFVEGHYITPDDCRAGNQDNNASYREVRVTQTGPSAFDVRINPTWRTQRGQAGVRAWKDVDPDVVETDVRVPGEGLFILAAKAFAVGPGVWRYSYALQNLNSDRSAGSFRIPLPNGISVTNPGFRDVDYHSGDPYDGTDWSVQVTDGAITWSAVPYAVNPNANALRYDTVYSFRFDANGDPTSTTVTIGIFKPGTPGEVTANTIGPRVQLVDCNHNGVHDPCDLNCLLPDCTVPCGGSLDCNSNGIPDECETDCNGNHVPDDCDIAGCPPDDPTCADCDENGIPDGCETDCDRNGVLDLCDIRDCPPEDRRCADCNQNRVPDICDPDCDGDGLPDTCDPPTDSDHDGVTDCLDRCPTTTPPGACALPETVICRFAVGVCLPDYPRDDCFQQGGVPNCDPQGRCADIPCLDRRCREGCLVPCFINHTTMLASGRGGCR